MHCNPLQSNAHAYAVNTKRIYAYYVSNEWSFFFIISFFNLKWSVCVKKKKKTRMLSVILRLYFYINRIFFSVYKRLYNISHMRVISILAIFGLEINRSYMKINKNTIFTAQNSPTYTTAKKVASVSLIFLVFIIFIILGFFFFKLKSELRFLK